MSQDNDAPRQLKSSISADVSAAIATLFDALGQIAELDPTPTISQLAATASQAATVVVDGLQDMASDLAEVQK